jgi:uncharacterized repeat protein (TIGR01451 family)
MKMIRFLLALAALFTPGLAMAADSVALSSTVFVEKMVEDSDGRTRITLQQPKVVTPGDRLVFILNYQNQGPKPATNFVVTNPLPSAVVYQGTADATAELSIDGGKSWGPLSALKVPDGPDRWRSARPEDVTHVRWTMKQAIPAGGQGKLSFRGIVR